MKNQSKKVKTTFSIAQSWGEGIGGYAHFETDDLTESNIIRLTKKTLTEEYETQKLLSFMGSAEPCRPTVKVVEYDTVANRAKYRGLKFSVEWR